MNIAVSGPSLAGSVHDSAGIIVGPPQPPSTSAATNPIPLSLRLGSVMFPTPLRVAGVQIVVPNFALPASPGFSFAWRNKSISVPGAQGRSSGANPSLGKAIREQESAKAWGSHQRPALALGVLLSERLLVGIREQSQILGTRFCFTLIRTASARLPARGPAIANLSPHAGQARMGQAGNHSPQSPPPCRRLPPHRGQLQPALRSEAAHKGGQDLRRGADPQAPI